MLRPHCVRPQTHPQETHTVSFPLQKAPANTPRSPAPSGLHSDLLTGSESFVTCFQFLTFQLESVSSSRLQISRKMLCQRKLLFIAEEVRNAK